MHIFERMIKVSDFDVNIDSILDRAVEDYNKRNGIKTTIPKKEEPKANLKQEPSKKPEEKKKDFYDKTKAKENKAPKPEKKSISGKKPKGEKIKEYLRKREEEKKWSKASVVPNNESKSLDEDKKFDIALGLATIGIAGLIGVGTIFASKAAYNWGYNKSYEAGSVFWKDTKENMEKRREEYKKLYDAPDNKQQNPPSNDNFEPDK